MKNAIKKVGLVFDGYLDRAGGVEKCILEVIRILTEEGYQIYICCLKKPDIYLIKKFFGEKIKIDKTYSITSKNIPYLHTVSRLFLIKPFIKMSKEVDFIIDINGGLLHRFLPPSFVSERYFVYRVGMPLEASEFFDRNFFQKLLGRIYLKTVYKLFIPTNKSRVICVSRSTAKAIKKYWHLKTDDLLYPPIKIEFFRNNLPKKNQVISVGRFSPEKNYLSAIDIFAKVAQERKDVSFVLAGATYIKETSKEYLARVKKKIAQNNLSKKIFLAINKSEQEIRKLMGESKIILNSQVKSDSFSIAVIEAMAAGCIPLVPRSGGAWEEIIDYGNYGFAFFQKREYVKIILKLLSDEELAKKYQQLAMGRVNFFGKESFKKKLIELIERKSSQKLS